MPKRVFPGVYASLTEIADFVKNSASTINFDSTEMFALETAVDEAVSNIIEHAYEGEGKGEIICSIEIQPEQIIITLEDHGKSFDPSCIPVPDFSAELDEREDHGLGYYLMCQLLDEIKYDFSDGNNRVRMVKKKKPDESSQRLAQAPWQLFLDMGEELLQQSNSSSLSERFTQIVENEFQCKAHLWLAEPYYPLPGEPIFETLPSAQVPEIVRESWNKKDKTGSSCEIALPITTQNNILGILHLQRNPNFPFTAEETKKVEGLAAFAAGFMQINRQVALKNWRYDQIALVRSVSSQITNVLDLDELSKRVTNLIQCSLNYYHVGLYTIEEGTDTLNFRASSLECIPDKKDPLLNINIGEGLVGKVAQTGKEIIARDVSKEPDYRHTESLLKTRAEAVLPLLVENRILGVLDIQSDKLETFHENDLLILRSLADNIALAVEGARLYNNLEKKADQIAAVAEINFALSSILDLDDLLQKVVDEIHQRFSIPKVYIYTVHPGRQKVIFQAGSSRWSRKIKANAFAFDLQSPKGMIPNVARTGVPMLANNVDLEPLFRPAKSTQTKTKSEMTIPLKFGQEVLGILDMQSDQPNGFDQKDLSLFEGLASGIALSIRNATLFRTEKWRRQVSDSFKDVASLLSSNLALDELLGSILRELENILPCDASAIWLLDDTLSQPQEPRRLRLAAVRGTTRQNVIEVTEKEEKVRDFLNTSIASKESIIRKQTDPYGPLGAACKFEQTYSSIAVPLLSADNIIGVLTMAHHSEDRYGSEAALIASTFASYSAIAIENARLYSGAQEDAWSSTVLLQVAESLQSITSEDELLSTMVRLTPLLVGINQCGFYLANTVDSSFDLKTWYGFNPAEDEKVIQASQSISLLKLRATLEPVYITDPKTELGIASIRLHDQDETMVLIPLLSHGDILGAFLVSHISSSEYGIRNRFNDQTLAILQGIAQQTSIALENIHLIESRQEEAYVTAVLLQVAQAVVSQNQLDDILDTIVHLMPILVGVDTCAIFLWDEKSTSFSVSNAISPSHAETEAMLNRSFIQGEFPILDYLLANEKMVACPLEDASIKISDWQMLHYYEVDTLDQDKKSNWLLGFPLSSKGVVYGALLAKESNVKPSFYTKRIELLRGVSQQTTLAIQNERLKEEMVGRERMEREFQLAREIQKNFLPNTLPEPKGWDIDMRWQTAREVGGDFYDAFLTKDHRLAVIIADVADKGMPAALYMTVTSTLLRAYALSGDSPAEVLEKVNELLVMESQNGMFVTTFFALLNPKTGVLEYANAGHNLPILIRQETNAIERLQKGGIALGVLQDVKYENKSLQINPLDTLLLYTDGVTEAFSTTGELYSEPRLVQELLKMQKLGAGEVLSKIESLIKDFQKSELPSDDLTMLAIHRK